MIRLLKKQVCVTGCDEFGFCFITALCFYIDNLFIIVPP